MRRRSGFWRGVWAGGATLAVMGAGRLIEVAPFPPELIVMRLFEVTPLPLFERSVIALGVWAKWLAFAGTTLASLAGAGVAGLIVPRIAFGESPFVRALCHGAVLTLLGLFLFLPVVGIDYLGQALPQRLSVPAPVGMAAGAVAYGLVYEGPQVTVWFVRQGRK